MGAPVPGMAPEPGIPGVTQPVTRTLPIDKLPPSNVIIDHPTYTKTQSKPPIIVSIERAIPIAAAAGSSAYGLAFAATPDVRPAVLAAIGAFLATIFARVVEGVIDQGGKQ